MSFEYYIDRPSVTRRFYPLLIYLHGYGENVRRHKLKNRDSLPGNVKHFPILQTCVVVTPFSPDGIWWDCYELKQFIKEIIKKEHIDISRIYLCGISMGGYAAWSLMSQFPNSFAAVIPICGGTNPFNRFLTLPFRWNQFNQITFKNNKHTAVWAFHGVLDIVVPYYESTRNIRVLQKNGNQSCRITLYNWSGHNIGKKTFLNPELYEWMISKQLSIQVLSNSTFK